MSPNRRDFLRASGVAALLTGGLAGCTERVQDSVPGLSGGPAYADWLYDTDELFDGAFRGFFAVDVEGYLDRKGALPGDVTDGIEETTDEATGLDVDEFERLVGVAAFDPGQQDEYGDEASVNSVVATGSFDAGDIEDRIDEASELSEGEEYEGYTLYRRRQRYDPSRTSAAAVTDGTVVGATADATDREEDEGGDDYSRGTRTGTPEATPQDGVTAEATVKLAIDAEAGNAPDLTGDGVLSEAVDDLGDGPMVGAAAFSGEELGRYLGFGEPSEDENETVTGVRDLSEGLVGVAGSANAEDESGDVTLRLYYEADTEVADRAGTVEDLRDDLEAESDALEVPDVDVSTSGRSVVVTITGDPSEFYDELQSSSSGSGSGSGDSGTETRTPQVAFSFDFAVESGADTGDLTITHDGGDAVAANQLLIAASDGSPQQQWGSTGEVTAGSSLTVQADSDDRVRIIWRSEDGSQSATLGLWQGPDA